MWHQPSLSYIGFTIVYDKSYGVDRPCLETLCGNFDTKKVDQLDEAFTVKIHHISPENHPDITQIPKHIYLVSHLRPSLYS